MRRILVLYATREGQTEKVAHYISQHLEQGGAQVQFHNAAESSAQSLDLASFDLLVFGASMHAGGLEKEIVQFINAHKQQITTRSRSFFLVLLSAATKERSLREQWLADAREKMAEQLTVSFDDTEMIAGALTYSKYPLPLKWLMRRIAKKAGEGTDIHRDYEYTDWGQVKRYAERLRTLS